MTKEQWIDIKTLEHIKQLAGLQFTPDEIAIMLGIQVADKDLFVKSCKMEVPTLEGIYQHFQSGRLEEEVLLRKAIFLAAKQGSPPAQNAAAKMIMNNKLKERGR